MKRLLNTLYITDEKAYLSTDGDNIVCTRENEEKFRIPFLNIESIYCFNYLGCSPSLMGKCVERGISLCFLSPQGRFLAKVCGETKGNVFLRKQQIECFDENLLLIKNNVASKLSNTRYNLKRSIRDNRNKFDMTELETCCETLTSQIDRVYQEDDIDIIRGIEGNCAKAYFYVFGNMIVRSKDDFKITGRSKRPPRDRVNAVLSFLYTIYTNDYASALECVGLDSYIGFYHALRSGRASLACDLVEETRFIVDRLVVSMINLGTLTKKDFDSEISGAVLLNDDGRKKVLTKWQEKKRESFTHPYLKQKIPYGLIPYVQSSLLAKYVRGEIEEYPSFVMR